MLLTVGRFMESASWLVKGVIFDAHKSHGFFREALFGHFVTLDPEKIALHEVAFFKDCKYEKLPPHNLPRLPLSICTYKGKSVFCLPGACCLVCFR